MRPKIAVTIGDPAGIGPEIAVRAAADSRVREACRPVLVGSAAVLARLGLPFEPESLIDVPVADAEAIRPGAPDAASGRATLACAARAIALARAGEVAGVVAGPHSASAINAAGTAFDGYPGFVARETGTDPNDVFLMLTGEGLRIVHVTLHVPLRDALALIDRPRVGCAFAATARVLGGLGIAGPRIAVAGVNPHAGEGGLLGREEIEVISPEIEAARARGLAVEGPFGADTMFLDRGYDAYVVMYHDQGHIAAKLFGLDVTSAWTIGTPVAFATVGHGSAAGIAGRGTADPASMVTAILRMARVASS